MKAAAGLILAAGAAVAAWALWPTKAAAGPLPPPPLPKKPKTAEPSGMPPELGGPPAVDLPLPEPKARAIALCDVAESDVIAWGTDAELPAFWAAADEPPTAPYSLAPAFGAGLINPYVVIVTNDGAFWYWDDGWHPAPLLAEDFCSWKKTHWIEP